MAYNAGTLIDLIRSITDQAAELELRIEVAIYEGSRLHMHVRAEPASDGGSRIEVDQPAFHKSEEPEFHGVDYGVDFEPELPLPKGEDESEYELHTKGVDPMIESETPPHRVSMFERNKARKSKQNIEDDH